MLNIFGSRLLQGILPFSWCFIGILVYPWLWMPVPWEMLLRSEIRRRTSAPLWQKWRRWMIRSAPFQVQPTSDCLVWKNFKLNLLCFCRFFATLKRHRRDNKSLPDPVRGNLQQGPSVIMSTSLTVLVNGVRVKHLLVITKNHWRLTTSLQKVWPLWLRAVHRRAERANVPKNGGRGPARGMHMTPSIFVFEKVEDMEVFLTACWDQKGLHVNSLCTDSHTTLEMVIRISTEPGHTS